MLCAASGWFLPRYGILSDIFMPNIDALGVMELLKHEFGGAMPLYFVMSGFGSSRLESEAVAAGAAYFFIKPFRDRKGRCCIFTFEFDLSHN